jgi:hypothetical protein
VYSRWFARLLFRFLRAHGVLRRDAFVEKNALELKGQRQWEEWRRSGQRPRDIPSGPDNAYRSSGWAGWGDFLGTGNVRGSKPRRG